MSKNSKKYHLLDNTKVSKKRLHWVNAQESKNYKISKFDINGYKQTPEKHNLSDSSGEFRTVMLP